MCVMNMCICNEHVRVYECVSVVSVCVFNE